MPLLKYEVHYRTYSDGGTFTLIVDTFTADEMDVDTFNITRFYRTGNLIRLYFATLEKVIVTPVDDEEIPA